MSSINLEIRAAEGGDDAKSFVPQLAAAYEALARRRGWKCHRISENPGHAGFHGIVLRVEGKGVENLEQEAGGHRVQRVPDNEKRGRVHTSTVTVAALSGSSAGMDSPYSRRSDGDFKVEWFRGSGAGGQHRNSNVPKEYTNPP